MCVYVYACYWGTCVCLSIWKPEVNVLCLLQSLSFVKQKTLKLTDTARLVGQDAPGTCLSPPSSGITVMHHYAQLLMWVLQTEAWVLMLTLQSQSLTDLSPKPWLGRS